jgi:hypothetical protein
MITTRDASYLLLASRFRDCLQGGSRSANRWAADGSPRLWNYGNDAAHVRPSSCVRFWRESQLPLVDSTSSRSFQMPESAV